MSNQNRVQPEVPTGGQYAAAIKSDDIPVIHGMTGDDLTALFKQRAAARAGLEYASAKYIADLMAKSPGPVYEENARTLAAANAITVDDVKHLDRVFNHGERPPTGMNTKPNRQPEGIPTGGQHAAQVSTTSSSTATGGPPASPPSTRATSTTSNPSTSTCAPPPRRRSPMRSRASPPVH